MTFDRQTRSHLTIKQLTQDGGGISLAVMDRPLRIEKVSVNQGHILTFNNG